jgi:ABC-type multidrug transport system ATPase subunit
MKRRLSVAISLIGNPTVTYLDEPSTGLDPASRRQLWHVVSQAKRNKAVVLTTHSMEEAEFLCDRLGIFIDGKLACLGNPKQLTARYGGYYVRLRMTVTHCSTLEWQCTAMTMHSAFLDWCLVGCSSLVPVVQVFTITTPEAEDRQAHNVVMQMSPHAKRTYALGGTSKYEMPCTDIDLSSIFDRIATAKQGGLTVLDWGVHNASLEDVFIRLAQAALVKNGTVAGGEV